MSTMVLALLLATAPVVKADGLEQQLVSAERPQRLAALEAVARLPKTPKELIEPLFEFGRLEASNAFTPPARRRQAGEPLKKIPHTGQEVILPRIKANPQLALNRRVVLCGSVVVSDVWPTPFPEEHYYSLFYRDLTATAEEGQTAHIVLSRELGQALVERLLRIQEDEGFLAQAAVRLQVTLPEVAYRGPEDWDRLVVLDWQHLNDAGDGWQPWVLAGLGRLPAVLAQGGRDVVEPLLARLIEPEDPAAVSYEGLLRTLYLKALVDLDQRELRTARQRFSRLTRSKSAGLSATWVKRTRDALFRRPARRDEIDAPVE